MMCESTSYTPIVKIGGIKMLKYTPISQHKERDPWGVPINSLVDAL